MQVHLSKSQIGLLVAGVVISGLTAFSSASQSGVLSLDSRGLLAEVIGSGYQKAGQVTFWKDGSTLTGDPNFMWDSVSQKLTAYLINSRGIASPTEFALYPGRSASNRAWVDVYGRIRAYGGIPMAPGAIEIRGGGLKLRSNERGITTPTCNDENRGLFWFNQSSIADAVWVCVNDNNGVYLWRQLLLNKGETGGL